MLLILLRNDRLLYPTLSDATFKNNNKKTLFSFFFLASPDGRLDDAILEIKCPYTGRDEKISPGPNFLFLEERNGCTSLKRNHNYFYQCQGQMSCTEIHKCFFIVYTNVDIFIEEIHYDQAFFDQSMFPLLNDFYDTHYKPFIVSQM